MPLPAPVARQPLHSRVIEMSGYLRNDGLVDVEGHLTDRKPYDLQIEAGPLVPARQPLHQMWIRLTLDQNLVVQEAIAATDNAPYADCQMAPPTLAGIVGLSIASGWVRNVKERLGGDRSCTHLTEMLIPLGTAAFQSIYPRLRSLDHVLDRNGTPILVGTCLAMRAEGEVVRMRWPAHHVKAGS